MPKKKKRENVLVICAHSDDHILGVGGTMAKYCEEGKHVHVVILSFGEKSHPWMKSYFTKQMREAENDLADKEIGCSSTFLDLKETKFMEGYPEVKERLLKLVLKEKPNKVFTHNNEDPHPDHKAANEIALDIIDNAKIKPEVYVFSIWNPFSFRKSHLPKMYVDISKTYKKKMSALKHFKSQRAALLLLTWGVIAREFKNGLHTGARVAEGFYRLR